MTDTPVVNVHKILETVEGDHDLMHEIVNMFLEEIPDAVKELGNILKEKDHGQLERRAHSLKNSIGNFGAKTAYDLAYELELAARENNFDQADETFQKLQTELIRVKTFFSAPDWDKTT